MKYLNTCERTITYSLSKLSKLNYITIKYEYNKRRIFLNNNSQKVASQVAKNCDLKVAKNCDHNINNNYYKNKYNNFKKEKIVPYWMEHPEVCTSKQASEDEIKELEELINDI